jgi:SpoU rRNA methylase family enzyme
MARATTEELKMNRLAAMTADKRAAFDATYQVTRLAVDFGDTLATLRKIATALGLNVTVDLTAAS